MDRPADHRLAAELRISAHGWVLSVRFDVSPAGAVTATFITDRAPAETRAIDDALDVAAAIAWLDHHPYDPATRDEVGRVGELRLLVDDVVRHRLEFHRGRSRPPVGPVDELIDRCAGHAPLLIG